ADVETARFQAFAGRHDAAGADQYEILGHDAVEHDGAHPDQALVADRARVQRDAMTDGDVGADVQRASTGRVRSVVGDVQHGAVLNAGACADLDRVNVAAHDCSGPDRRTVADPHAPADDRAGVDIDARAEHG